MSRKISIFEAEDRRKLRALRKLVNSSLNNGPQRMRNIVVKIGAECRMHTDNIGMLHGTLAGYGTLEITARVFCYPKTKQKGRK